MRTIKECICDSTKKFEDGVFPICLSGFITSMSMLLIYDADMRLATPQPDLKANGKTYSGEAKEKVSTLDIINVLNGNDLFRHTGQFIQLQGFLMWILEQDEPGDNDDFIMWYDIDFIGKKWNEYVRMMREKAKA